MKNKIKECDEFVNKLSKLIEEYKPFSEGGEGAIVWAMVNNEIERTAGGYVGMPNDCVQALCEFMDEDQTAEALLGAAVLTFNITNSEHGIDLGYPKTEA